MMSSNNCHKVTALYPIMENKRIILLEKRMRMRVLIDNIKQNNLTQQSNIINQPQLSTKNIVN